MGELTRAAIDALDSGAALVDTLGMDHQLGDALWRADAAQIPAADSSDGLVVCAMGGSAIGADLAFAAIGARASRPLTLVRGYEPPPWIGPGTFVLAQSYSGNTEETLACFEAAGTAGATRAVLTTGGALAELAREQSVPVIGAPSGFQPRSAVAYGVVGALVCAEQCGAAPSLRTEVEDAAALLTELAAEWGPEAPAESEAKAVATALGDRVPVIYGAGSTAAVARRWKTQLNEMAEVPAFWSELPEADHNEICGFSGAPLHAIFLEDEHADSRLLNRIDLTAAAAADDGLEVVRVRARGESPLERILSLTLLGDLVAVYVAALRGTDPTRIAAIDRFKDRLDGLG